MGKSLWFSWLNFNNSTIKTKGIDYVFLMLKKLGHCLKGKWEREKLEIEEKQTQQTKERM